MLPRIQSPMSEDDWGVPPPPKREVFLVGLNETILGDSGVPGVWQKAAYICW